MRRDSGVTAEQVNPYGGAIALVHPVGATGAILTVRLAKDMVRRDPETGIVTVCIGGGQALAAPSGGSDDPARQLREGGLTAGSQ